MSSSFRHLTIEQRHAYLRDRCSLSPEDLRTLGGSPLPGQIAEHLIENAIGYFQIPMGIATQFRIDGRELLIPMAVEETSIIAAASATAKWICSRGSIRTRMQGRWIIGQIQFPQVMDPGRMKAVL